MDDYSVRTKAWLDNHFQRVDSDGIYVAHQPIYGFRVGHCETLLSVNYIRTAHIMRALSSCDIGSLLDVGAAEGHKAFLAKKLLGVPHVECCDLSSEAAKRAGEIFKLQARQADIHALPYDDLQFDAVLCCETLEHVADVKRASAELVRVAKKIIVIAVPKENPEDVKAERESGLMHGHINAFDASSFDYLKAAGWVICHKKILSRSLYRLRVGRGRVNLFL